LDTSKSSVSSNEGEKQRLSSHSQGMAGFSGIRSIFASLVGIVLFILVLSPNAVNATALTYKIDANEKGCFYAWVDKVGEKVAFYFAVSFRMKQVADDRYKQVVHLISITKSRILDKKSSWMEKRKDKVISYLPLKCLENTHSVSPTT
jgi:hypothetical protein